MRTIYLGHQNTNHF